MSIELTGTREIAGELYLLPPARFVAARDRLVQQARAAGNRELAGELASLRRPTRSAWLVNLLARYDREQMDQLIALGRELRQAQVRLDAAGLARLSARRQQLVAELVGQARRRAAEAGTATTDAVLGQVEATLLAALVDLAGSFTVASGHLVRPMSHNGFGPMPHADDAPSRATDGEVEGRDGARWQLRVVESDEPPIAIESYAGDDALRRAEAELATAESAHWQREHDLADAEAALESAVDRIDWLDGQRMEARREKVAAQQRVAQARAAQQDAVRALAEARRKLDDTQRGFDS
jgi:hypothetical protein